MEFLKTNIAKSIKLFGGVLRNYAKRNTTTVLVLLFSMLKLLKALKILFISMLWDKCGCSLFLQNAHQQF